MMLIIDLHCDALMKLADAKGKITFHDSPQLDVNYERLKKGGIKLQAFALFVYPSLPIEAQFQGIIDQIHYFYTEIATPQSNIRLIREWSMIDQLADNEIGALLTLEGVDAIGNDLHKLTLLYQLGVRSIGLTWNSANLAADGVAEARNGGLTKWGRQIIEWCNAHQVLVDCSHLGDAGFWEMIELAKYPIASHSNARSICNHRRNLTDEQIRALIARDAMIHLVFCPPFVKQGGNATIEDLIAHIDHIIALGGVNHLGFGSDFDGIVSKIPQLAQSDHYPNLITALKTHYDEATIKGFCSDNFHRHYGSITAQSQNGLA